MPTDTTMNEISLFGSIGWAATRCGLSREQFRRKKPVLETDGFPTPDKITGTYLKADIDAWIEKRRQVSDKAFDPRPNEAPKTEFNFDKV